MLANSYHLPHSKVSESAHDTSKNIFLNKNLQFFKIFPLNTIKVGLINDESALV